MTLQFDVTIRKGILEKKSLTSLTRVLLYYHLPSSSNMCSARAPLSSETLLVHIVASSASPLEHEIVLWVRHNKETLSKKVSLDYLHVR